MFNTLQAQGRPISLAVEASAELIVAGWAESLREAFTNLVFNAVDAMPDGGTLRLRAQAANGGPEPGMVLVEVTDTGPGIPEQVLPSVCEPFFTTRSEGTGLGLAIAKRYVEQNGGRLEIESRPGAGTTVRLRLPTETPA